MLIRCRHSEPIEDNHYSVILAVNLPSLLGHPIQHAKAGRYRLIANGSHDEDTYECYYIFGLSSNDPQKVVHSMSAIDSIAQNWREKLQKSCQPGNDLFHSVNVTLFPAADLAEQVKKPSLPDSK